jgi:hypothetical protein
MKRWWLLFAVGAAAVVALVRPVDRRIGRFSTAVAAPRRPRLFAVALVVLLAAVAGAGASSAGSETLPCPPPGGAAAYAVSLRALTGPDGADLRLPPRTRVARFRRR